MRLNQSNQYIKRVRVLHEKIDSKHEYPFCLPAVKSLKELPLHPQVTYFVGENGMGKSTLLEAIAIAAGFNPEGGSLYFNFSTQDSHSKLDQFLRLIKGVQKPKDGFFLRAETFYNVASYIEEIDQDPGGGSRVIDQFGGVSLHEQSHGESFFATFMNRFKGNGLYILDEPEAALSPIRQLSMLARMQELTGNASQFIIATHSPMLMAYPDSIIYEFTKDGIQETTLESTEHYSIMKQFFHDKDRMLFHLFNK